MNNIVHDKSLAYSVEEFLKLHNISRAFFYKLRKEGKAPKIMRVGNRTLISIESATQWRKDMEEKND